MQSYTDAKSLCHAPTTEPECSVLLNISFFSGGYKSVLNIDSIGEGDGGFGKIRFLLFYVSYALCFPVFSKGLRRRARLLWHDDD